MLNCIKWIMHVWATVYPYRLHLKISTLLDIMYTYWVSPFSMPLEKNVVSDEV